MTKITAEQAIELAGPTVQERVDAVYPLIEEAAKNKKRSVHLHDDFWVYGGYKTTKEWKEAVELLKQDGYKVRLKQDGYKVRFFHEERQFVDMYTVVEW